MYGNNANNGRTIVFCQTKKDCNELVVDKDLSQDAKVLHGDIAQAQRETTLQGFRQSRFHVLIATDVAARGLDIKGVDLVIQVQPPAGAFSNRADVETYVHRSGRTGRAGRKGHCITLYKHSESDIIRQIERGTGNTLRRIGAPQPEDILVAEAAQTGEDLTELGNDVIERFLPIADNIIAKMGAREALAASLAKITGFTSTKMFAPRSLLQCAEGYITVKFDSNGSELYGLGYVWNALRRIMSPDAVESVRGMTLLADSLGAVFDFDCKFKDELDKALADPRSGLELVTELPELQAKSFGGRGGGGGGGGGGRGGFRSGGGRGGRGRGRGRW